MVGNVRLYAQASDLSGAQYRRFKPRRDLLPGHLVGRKGVRPHVPYTPVLPHRTTVLRVSIASALDKTPMTGRPDATPATGGLFELLEIAQRARIAAPHRCRVERSHPALREDEGHCRLGHRKSPHLLAPCERVKEFPLNPQPFPWHLVALVAEVVLDFD